MSARTNWSRNELELGVIPTPVEFDDLLNTDRQAVNLCNTNVASWDANTLANAIEAANIRLNNARVSVLHQPQIPLM